MFHHCCVFQCSSFQTFFSLFFFWPLHFLYLFIYSFSETQSILLYSSNRISLFLFTFRSLHYSSFPVLSFSSPFIFPFLSFSCASFFSLFFFTFTVPFSPLHQSPCLPGTLYFSDHLFFPFYLWTAANTFPFRVCPWVLPGAAHLPTTPTCLFFISRTCPTSAA